jgi:large conductance mechanosensitive channel
LNDMLKEFRDFLLRGNVLDLAVGIVIGSAFTMVVNSLVQDLLMPVVALVFGKPDFRTLTFSISDTIFFYGAFLTALVSFMMVAAALFFLVIKPVNVLLERKRGDAGPTDKTCPECLSTIPLDARRCAFCAQPVAA